MPHCRLLRLLSVPALLVAAPAAARAQVPVWYESQKLVSPDAQLFGEFGENFMINGEVMIASADEDDLPTEFGEVWVFRWDPALKQWVDEQRLEATPHNGQVCGGTCHFGHTAAVQGDVIAVGVPHDEPWGFMSGAGYVFRYDPVSGVWNEEEYFVAPYGGVIDHIGHGVDVGGDVVLFGGERSTVYNTFTEAGRVQVLRWDGSQWNFEQELISSDIQSDDRFGYHVAVENDVAVIGAQGDQGPPSNACDGSAYVYRYDPVTGVWNEEQKLPTHGANEVTQFAMPVDISRDGNRIMVGMPRCGMNGQEHGGSVVVYEYDAQAGVWNLTDEFQPSDLGPSDDFGAWVAMDGDLAVVGSWLASQNGPFSGAAYLFERDPATNTWQEKVKLAASDNAAFDTLGWCVSINNGWIGVGSYNNDANGLTNSGAVYLFKVDELTIDQHPVPTGATSTITSVGADPFEGVYLAGSIAGLGSTMVPPLGAALDLDQPMQVGNIAVANQGGKATWDVFFPGNVSGMTVWFQAISTSGWTSRVLQVQVQ